MSTNDVQSITIGTSEYGFSIEGHYTTVWNEDSETMFQLRWAASAKEVEAAVYGYFRGRQEGKIVGRLETQLELRNALGITPA